LAISSHYHPVIGRLVAGVYLGIIQKAPGLWGFLYDNQEIIALVRGLRWFYLLFGGRRIRTQLAALESDVIVCTHAAPLGVLMDARAKGAFSCPVVAVLTDFGVHGYWLRPQADLYFTATQDSARFVAAHAVAGERLQACGIPIHPVFAEPVDRAALRRSLGVGEETRVILLSGGSRGLGQLPRMTRGLLEKLSGVLLLVACGNNARLRGQLQAAHAGDRRLRALGLQTPAQMRDLLGACDLVIGKAGGLTSAESLAMGVPLILVDPIPGQEERNAVYLESKGAAVRARKLEDLGSEVKALLEDGARLALLRAAAGGLGRPQAARRVIETIAAKVAGRAGHLLY
jgi:processive 1,2-diacylglycerol beta-glucosyltransferase